MLTLQFIPHGEIEFLDSEKRIRKLLNIAKENKIVLLEGRLKKDEETKLIQKTMEEVDQTFKGIELGVVYPGKNTQPTDPLRSLKGAFVNMMLGDRRGITIIGPASIVKEIKQDPHKIQLLTQELKTKKKKKARKR